MPVYHLPKDRLEAHRVAALAEAARWATEAPWFASVRRRDAERLAQRLANAS